MNAPLLTQKRVPGIVGISTFVDHAYQLAMQRTAVAAAGDPDGPINQLRTATVTLDFHRLVTNLKAGRKDEAEEQVAKTSQALAAAGADFIVVTSGTTSTLTARARERVSIPFLDIAEACLKGDGPAGPVGLLSTSYTVAGGIFHAAAKRRDLALVVPQPQTAERVDRAIFGELVRGSASEGGMQVFRDAIAELAAAGARSIILGNTDLTLVVDDLRRTSTVPLVDSVQAHATAAAHAALTGEI
jgi:aspartate racemase